MVLTAVDFGVCVRSFLHVGEIAACAIAPNENVVVSGGLDKTIAVLAEDSSTHALTGHKSKVEQLTFSCNGALLVSSSVETAARVWAMNAKELKSRLAHPSVLTHCSCNPTKPLVATCCLNDTSVRVWSLETHKIVLTATAAGTKVAQCCWSSDGSYLASWSDTDVIGVWDVNSLAKHGDLQGGHKKKVTLCLFGPSNAAKQIALSVAEDFSFCIWDVQSLTLIGTFTANTKKIDEMSVHPNGELVATCGADSVVKIWNIPTTALMTSLSGHSQRVLRCSFSPNGTLLATGSRDNTVILWNTKTFKPLATLSHPAPVTRLVWSRTASNSELATTAGDMVRVWCSDAAHTDIKDTAQLDMLVDLFDVDQFQIEKDIVVDANKFVPLERTIYMSRVTPLLDLFVRSIHSGQWATYFDEYFIKITLVSRRFIQKQIDAITPETYPILIDAYQKALEQHRSTAEPLYHKHIRNSSDLLSTTESILKIRSDISRHIKSLQALPTHQQEQLMLAYSSDQSTEDVYDLLTHAVAVQPRFKALLQAVVATSNASGGRVVVEFGALQRMLVVSGLRHDKDRWGAKYIRDAIQGIIVCEDLVAVKQCLQAIRTADPLLGSWGAAEQLSIPSRVTVLDVVDNISNPCLSGKAECLIYLTFLDDPNKHICQIKLCLAAMYNVLQAKSVTDLADKAQAALDLLEFFGCQEMVAQVHVALNQQQYVEASPSLAEPSAYTTTRDCEPTAPVVSEPSSLSNADPKVTRATTVVDSVARTVTSTEPHDNKRSVSTTDLLANNQSSIAEPYTTRTVAEDLSFMSTSVMSPPPTTSHRSPSMAKRTNAPNTNTNTITTTTTTPRSFTPPSSTPRSQRTTRAQSVTSTSTPRSQPPATATATATATTATRTQTARTTTARTQISTQPPASSASSAATATTSSPAGAVSSAALDSLLTNKLASLQQTLTSQTEEMKSKMESCISAQIDATSKALQDAFEKQQQQQQQQFQEQLQQLQTNYQVHITELQQKLESQVELQQQEKQANQQQQAALLETQTQLQAQVKGLQEQIDVLQESQKEQTVQLERTQSSFIQNMHEQLMMNHDMQRQQLQNDAQKISDAQAKKLLVELERSVEGVITQKMTETRTTVASLVKAQGGDIKKQVSDEIKTDLRNEVKKAVEASKHEIRYEIAKENVQEFQDLRTKLSETQELLARRKSFFRSSGSDKKL